MRRSRERRERAAAQGFEMPARGLSVTALLALVGVPATAVGAAKVLGDDDGGGALGGGTARAAIERPAPADPRSSVGTAVSGATASVWKEAKRPAAQAARGDAAPTVTAGPRKTSSTATANLSSTATATAGTQAELGAAPAASAARAGSAAGASAARAASAGSAAAASGARAASATPSQRVARAARRGGGVVELQRKLGVPADGDFGPKTERALKRWQRRHGLVADGIAGPHTRRALGLGPGKVLKRERPARHRRGGHRRAARHARPAMGGGGVRGLQRALGVSADGVFGPATERALKRWQRAQGLTADGIAGPQTRARMGLGPGPVLKRKGGHRRSAGGGSSVVQRVIAAANRIATKPYKYGGGHGSFTDSGYDCSGSVSYALHGGGLLSAPLDSGEFMSYGAPGAGRHITIYANPGHVYMTIDGRRFDTSARSETGSRWSGTTRGTAGYVVRHPPGL